MSTELVMPKLSDTMKEGSIVRWLKAEGDPVAAGEVIAEIQSDKATIEFEAYSPGVLSKILVPADQSVAVGTPICLVADESETAAPPSAAPTATKAPPPAPPKESPKPKEPAQAESKPAAPKEPAQAESKPRTPPKPPAPKEPAAAEPTAEDLGESPSPKPVAAEESESGASEPPESAAVEPSESAAVEPSESAATATAAPALSEHAAAMRRAKPAEGLARIKFGGRGVQMGLSEESARRVIQSTEGRP